MGFFSINAKMDMLQKSQENLEVAQKNVEIVSAALSILPSGQPLENPSVETEEGKRKAAYALNLCMVSVSQIIDYNDIHILDQEYDAILNNLNLEEMPKDEALLSILKQLLDVITFFRIEGEDRKFFEKEYQQKMKNAIWSAVPNLGLLVAGGSPVTMAISLASQVGIGYMNYRKEKAQNLLEKEKNDWQLQRSAMEQLNGLRRELFDTAWRLAERYQFPDRYRITETQIARYNEILLDADPLRRYERLEYIKDKFEAYPPFWYYLGAAANEVYRDAHYDADTRGMYKGRACEWFSMFLKQTEGNLLREDKILASGALEYFELLIDSGSESQAYLEHLIDRAIDASGDAHDVLELAAFSYMQLGLPQKAIKLFRALVNDGYNQIVNAQLLSSIYVNEYIESGSLKSKSDYETLKFRVGAEFLFPMPPQKEMYGKEELQRTFIQCQRVMLLKKCALVLSALIKKYSSLYNTALLNSNTKNGCNDLLAAHKKRTEDLFFALNSLYDAVRSLPLIDGNEFYNSIEKSIRENKEWFEKGGNPSEVMFEAVTKSAFNCAAKAMRAKVTLLPDMAEIARVDSEIRTVCISQDIALPELAIGNSNVSDEQRGEVEQFGVHSYEDISEEERKERAKRDEMHKCIRAYAEDLILDDTKKRTVYLYLEGDADFDKYFNRHPIFNFALTLKKQQILAVINDTSIHDIDLLLTTQGVLYCSRAGFYKVCSSVCLYKNISETNDRECRLKIGKFLPPYQNGQVDLKKLFALFQELEKIYTKYAITSQDEKNDLAEQVRSTLTEGNDDSPAEYRESWVES